MVRRRSYSVCALLETSPSSLESPLSFNRRSFSWDEAIDCAMISPNPAKKAAVQACVTKASPFNPTVGRLADANNGAIHAKGSPSNMDSCVFTLERIRPIRRGDAENQLGAEAAREPLPRAGGCGGTKACTEFHSAGDDTIQHKITKHRQNDTQNLQWDRPCLTTQERPSLLRPSIRCVRPFPSAIPGPRGEVRSAQRVSVILNRREERAVGRRSSRTAAAYSFVNNDRHGAAMDAGSDVARSLFSRDTPGPTEFSTPDLG
jgi:hypothetical protein